jgi:hypothetical protein
MQRLIWRSSLNFYFHLIYRKCGHFATVHYPMKKYILNRYCCRSSSAGQLIKIMSHKHDKVVIRHLLIMYRVLLKHGTPSHQGNWLSTVILRFLKSCSICLCSTWSKTYWANKVCFFLNPIFFGTFQYDSVI